MQTCAICGYKAERLAYPEDSRCNAHPVTKYIARIAFGSTYRQTTAYDTRDEAAKRAFDLSSARSCSTEMARLIDGTWRAFGGDMRFHDRSILSGVDRA